MRALNSLNWLFGALYYLCGIGLLTYYIYLSILIILYKISVIISFNVKIYLRGIYEN